MYKNRSRGLKRAASVLTSGVDTSSNLSEERPAPEPEKTTNQQREPLREQISKNTRRDLDETENERPPAKKVTKRNDIELGNTAKDDSKIPKTQPKAISQTQSKPQPSSTSAAKVKPGGSRRSRDQNKTSILNNHVDVDVSTMYMSFPSRFEELVTKSGFKLQDGDNPFLLSKDQAVFVRNLTILLSQKEDYPEEFLEGLGKYIRNNDNFRKMLLDTQTDPEFEDARSSQQDSLIRMLLCVDSIQPKVMVMLLEKLVALIQRSEREVGDDSFPWVEMIVKRFCFLDNIVDGTALFNDIFRLLQMAPLSVQQEIIYNLPYVMGDAHHDEVAERLLNLMNTKKDLTRAVLQALGSLPLSSTQSAEIRNQMLVSLQSAPIEFIPDIVKFVFDEQSSDHDQIISGLRNSLPFTRLREKLLAQKAVQQVAFAAEFASTKSLTFRNLRGAFLSIPSLATAWCKNIKSILSPNDHRPIDIMMLVLMHCKAGNRRQPVEMLWRNRIKTKMFTHTLLEETFEVLLVVLKKYKDDVLNVASILLRNSDQSIREFGSLMFKLSFIHFESHNRRQVVSDLILQVGSGETCAQVALDVLLELASDHLDKLSRLTILLQNLLENIDKLRLLGVRQMMDLLCRIAYSPETESGAMGTLGDNISIIVHKQLGSFEPQIKRKGVVSAVMMLKYMAVSLEDNSNVSLESNSIDSLPPGRPREAGQLLDLMVRCTRSSHEVLGYCLDQLSFMIYRCQNLEHLFIQYLVDRMEDTFMASYLPDDDSGIQSTSRGSSLEIRLKDQYCLDKDSEEPIALGIGILVLKDARNSKEGSTRQTPESTYPLLVLNALFRLLRVLKFRVGDESLEGIDALLGCAVNMPAHETIVDFNTLGPSQQADVIDCLFYCVNWFREIINAFANTNVEAYLEKVMVRLRNLVALQSTLARLLANTMNYTPPQCMFYDKTKKLQFKVPSDKTKKKGKGKAKKTTKKKLNESAAVEDTTQINEESEEEEKDKEEDSQGPVDISLYRNFLRELDLDVFCLMKQDLIMTPQPERGSDTTPDLGPAELRFLLEDYVAKLEHSFPTGGVNRFTLMKSTGDVSGNFAIWDLLPVQEKATNAISLLPILCEKLEQIGESCRNLLDANDGIVDGPGMFVEGTANVKICFALLLRAMTSTFAWNGFNHSQNQELLSKGMKVLATRIDSTGKRSSIFALIGEAADYLKRFHDWVLHLEAGVNLVKLLQILSSLWDLYVSKSSSRQTRVNPTRSILKDVCNAFLRRPWSSLDGATEKGVAYTMHVETLARIYFDCVENKLDLLQELVPKLYNESKDLTNKESSFETFPSISKYNFYVLCRVIYSTLAKGIQSETMQRDTAAVQIKAWSTVFKVLEGMVEITQSFTGRPYLAAMLKHGQILLKLFLDKGMPILEGSLRNNTEEVMSILRSSQTTTRFINKICLSCKTSQDSALTAHVPKIRGTMEMFLYRVKGMLALNNIESAWHMGNLRNRDVHNVEITTQESNEDEEVPEDEEERDEDITGIGSDSEEEEDQRIKGKRKSRKQQKKKKRSRRSGSGSEDEDESGKSDDGGDDDNDDDCDDGDNTSISTAY
ncbi:Fanconi anemia group D2 protein [Frankliniella fusca]|uniref:Fanconi anemia group D2 protein n=1 Tax=Frankliniella fusca TaxID=407009 RepID=A0AAE1H2N6_9NEOP|nr:Fanconi anemia group D2 protein [Frankliniella fusca]